MFVEDNPLMTLCAVASTFRDLDASTSGMQDQHVASSPPPFDQDTAFEKAQEKTEIVSAKQALKSCSSKRLVSCIRNVYQASMKLEEGIDLKSIPNHRISEFIENTSDELSKKFSYKCKYSPNMCSEVKESYGNDEKAFNEIKRHLVEQHFAVDSSPDAAIKAKPDKSKNTKQVEPLSETMNVFLRPPRSHRSFPRRKVTEMKLLNKRKAFLPQQTEETNKRGNVHGQLVSCSADDNCPELNGILNTVKYGEFEHTYAKCTDVNPPVRETGQKKNRRQNMEMPVTKFDLTEHLNADLLSALPIIPTDPFPHVFTPIPFEAVCNVELDLNGDLIVEEESICVQPSTSRISFKQVSENKMGRKRLKNGVEDNIPRSVLECVENRVACKSNASADQKDSLMQYDSIENSENVEKSIHDIAWRNIQILCQQRKKRKYRDKPSVYICEICNKHFTANTSLTYHYLGHLKIKPFKCNICYRTFTRRHSLKYHMMIHANKNRFQCGTCKRLFRHPSHYKEHLRKHTGEEPFSCKFCSNKFKTRNSFKRHLKMQHQKLLTSNGIVPIRNDS